MTNVRSLFCAVALLASIVATGSSGCGPGDPCKGGVVLNGVCSAKCDPAKCVAGNTCVGNACVLVCTSHNDCSSDGTQACLAAVEDGTSKAITICKESGEIPGLGARCPTKTECPAPLRCISAGVGDADAYCTNEDCGTDDDCGQGFYCGTLRDPHGLCGSDIIKGNNNVCGKTTEPCISEANLTANGRQLFPGTLCLLRKVCLKRDACAPCASDLDCSRKQGQRCGSVGGAKVCLSACSRDLDCFADAKCVEGLCAPRSGACKGKGGFCEPCINDVDCGEPESTSACTIVDGEMRACFDLAFTAACTTSADCPAAPSGLKGECLDEAAGVQPDNSVYHKCYFPKNVTTEKTSCW